jgi:hypothetical protein
MRVDGMGGREQQAPDIPPASPSSRPAASAATLAKRAVLVAAAAAVLFFCYWRQSLSAPLSSDGSGNVLQAWDMLHGNLLLHNWWVSDVSFYTTELPQYALIEAVLGLGPWVVHVGAAMTYTLLVLLAAVVAKGRAAGMAGLARALLAAGLMLAPQLSATSILLLSPDHTGTTVPLFVIWLLIDRASPGGRPPGTPRDRGNPSPRTPRGLIPVLVGVLFAWTMAADSIVLLTGIIPLVLVCLLRARPGRARGMRAGDRPAGRWYELSLAAAAAVAGVAGSFAPRIITALGGFQQSPVGTDTDLGQLQHGSWVTLQAFLELFGANVFNTSFFGAHHPIEVVFVALHLAGAITVVCALGVAARRFLRPGELIVPVFAVAIVLNLGAYMISTHAQDLLGAREMAAVLPLGAVLAGRTLGDRVLAWTRAARTWFVPVLAVITVGYLAAFGYGAAQASVPPSNEPLAAWLMAHRLSDGLATYWQANSTTVDSHHQVLVNAVVIDSNGQLVPYQWETDDADYNPALHDANFVVTDGFSALPGLEDAAVRTFGSPARIYHASGYTIMVWNRNLLTRLG